MCKGNNACVSDSTYVDIICATGREGTGGKVTLLRRGPCMTY